MGLLLALPLGDGYNIVKVVFHKIDVDSNVKRKINHKTCIDKREYIVEFPDGSESDYTTKSIV